MMADLQDQIIRQHCKALRMPTIGGQFARLADAALREGQTHIGYLEALLAAEIEERESRAIARLLHEARLPRMKTLDEFKFELSEVAAIQLRTLAQGDYVTGAEPILLVVMLARAKLTSLRVYALPPAASAAGFGSRPRPG
jgi:DNA replication protein DnaC